MAVRYVSIEMIIEDVYRNEGYAHELDWGDAIEWAGRALKLIGAPSLMIDKITGESLITPNVSIVDYRGELPIDFDEMLPGGCRDSSSKETYDHSTDSFVQASNLSGESPKYIISKKTYSLNDTYIFTNTETAILELAYRAIKIDDKGFPMVPDVERVIKAVSSYITFRIDHVLWRKNKLAERIYRDSEKEWLWYVGSAGTALRIQSPDKRESWVKAATRLLPVMYHHSTSYAFAGTREDLNIGSGSDAQVL